MATTAEELERKLWIASKKYVKGEIELDELEEVENVESENLKSAVHGLAKRRVNQTLLNVFRRTKKKEPVEAPL